MSWYPKRPQSLAEANISSHTLQESILKLLYMQGATRGIALRDALRLPYSLLDNDLKELRQQDMIAPVGGSGIGGYEGMDFALTTKGIEWVVQIMKRSPYVGPMAVSLNDYFQAVAQQKMPLRWIKRHHLESAFSDISVAPELLSQLGPAINSGGPIFLYGKPGNGKTIISERLARVFRFGMFIPYSIQVDGQIIRVFDEKVHKEIPIDRLPESHILRTSPLSVDSRWTFVVRPFIIVGGELTLEMLDLVYRDGQNCYEAPFQLKANGGVLLVDDFGRQIVRPKDFLNRWIFPLEKKIDFLTFTSGKKFEVPFEQTLIFSTNLNPADLADEAFWRRVKYKIAIADPTEEAYRKIFEATCASHKLPFDNAVFKHLIQKHYRDANRPLRAVHPRDILAHVVDNIAYRDLPMQLTNELIDNACEPYFSNSISAPEKPWSDAA